MIDQFIKPSSSVEIAEKDIYCFKLVVPSAQANNPWFAQQDGKIPVYYSLHENFRYVTGNTYLEERWGIEDHPSNNSLIFGFRSFDSSVVAHSLKFAAEHTVVVQFKIPKGSLYLHNKDTSEYLSNQIKCIGYYPIFRSLWDSIIYPVTKLISLF